MQTQKLEQFDQLVLAIQRQWGTKALSKGFELPKRDKKAITTGFEELDALTGLGGIPANEISLFVGGATSGVTTIAYTIAAHAQQAEHILVYFDLTQTLDPAYAADCGIDLKRLLIAHPGDWLQGLNMLRDLVALPYSGLAIFDGFTPHGLPLRQMDDLATTLTRIRGVLHQSTWTLLVLLPQVASRSLDEYVALAVVAQWQEWIYEYKDVIGYRITLTTSRNKFHPAGQSTTLTISLKGDV